MSETVEEKARRRRWLTLAEFVAVAGVIIAGLGLWQNWADRRADRADAIAAQASVAQARGRLELTGAAVDGGDALTLTDARHELTDLTIAFPHALGIEAQRPAGEPRIDARAFAKVLLKLTDHSPDDRTGRLPVLIGARYVDGDATRSASGIYDVIWRTHGRALRGRVLDATGLRLRQRGGDQAALDAAWAREKP